MTAIRWHHCCRPRIARSSPRRGGGSQLPAWRGSISIFWRQRRRWVCWAQIVGEGRATAAELSRIAELCGLLPLALRVAGMFLHSGPRWSGDTFVVALTDERKRLNRLKFEGSADLDVAASLALSVGELRRARPDLADRWHELAAFPASFDTVGAAVVWDQPVEAADQTLGALLSRSMVLYDPTQQRWRLHDLMRDLAGGQGAVEVLGAPADLAARLTAARARNAEHYQGVLKVANDFYLKGNVRFRLGWRCSTASGATSRLARRRQWRLRRTTRLRRVCA